MEYLTPEQVRDVAKRYTRRNGGQRAIAEKLGVSRPYVSMMINGKKKLSAGMLDLICAREITLFKMERND